MAKLTASRRCAQYYFAAAQHSYLYAHMVLDRTQLRVEGFRPPSRHVISALLQQ